MKKLIPILALLLLALVLPSCEAFNKLTPEQQARLTAAGSRLFDKALMLGEAKLDRALGLPPASVVIPKQVPPLEPVAVTASTK